MIKLVIQTFRVKHRDPNPDPVPCGQQVRQVSGPVLTILVPILRWTAAGLEPASSGPPLIWALTGPPWLRGPHRSSWFMSEI